MCQEYRKGFSAWLSKNGAIQGYPILHAIEYFFGIIMQTAFIFLLNNSLARFKTWLCRFLVVQFQQIILHHPHPQCLSFLICDTEAMSLEKNLLILSC